MLGNWPKGIIEDRYEWHQQGYGEQPSMIEELYEVRKPKQGSYDQRTKAIGMGKLNQETAQNTSVTYRRPSEAWTAYCVYRKFTDGLELEQEDVEDFPVEHAKSLVKDTITTWGEKTRLTEDDFSVSPFINGGLTAGHADFKNVIPGSGVNQNTDGLAYDGFPFFNRSNNLRSSRRGGTYYNAQGGLALSEANYEAQYNLMLVTNAKDERDERISLKMSGEKPVLLVPTQLHSAAARVINSEYLPGTDQNDKNAWYQSARIVEWDALNPQPTMWFLGMAKKGIRFYRRGTPEIRTFRDEDNGAYKATIRVRYGFMVYDWRYWVGANVPTS